MDPVVSARFDALLRSLMALRTEIEASTGRIEQSAAAEGQRPQFEAEVTADNWGGLFVGVLDGPVPSALDSALGAEIDSTTFGPALDSTASTLAATTEDMEPEESSLQIQGRVELEVDEKVLPSSASEVLKVAVAPSNADQIFAEHGRVSALDIDSLARGALSAQRPLRRAPPRSPRLRRAWGVPRLRRAWGVPRLRRPRRVPLLHHPRRPRPTWRPPQLRRAWGVTRLRRPRRTRLLHRPRWLPLRPRRPRPTRHPPQLRRARRVPPRLSWLRLSPRRARRTPVSSASGRSTRSSISTSLHPRAVRLRHRQPRAVHAREGGVRTHAQQQRIDCPDPLRAKAIPVLSTPAAISAVEVMLVDYKLLSDSIAAISLLDFAKPSATVEKKQVAQQEAERAGFLAAHDKQERHTAVVRAVELSITAHAEAQRHHIHLCIAPPPDADVRDSYVSCRKFARRTSPRQQLTGVRSCLLRLDYIPTLLAAATDRGVRVRLGLGQGNSLEASDTLLLQLVVPSCLHNRCSMNGHFLIQLGFSLPSCYCWNAVLLRHHTPWPPPTELQMVSFDAGLRPLPWPSFNIVERHFGPLWRPPWYVPIQQTVRCVPAELLESREYLMVICWNSGATMIYLEMLEHMDSDGTVCSPCSLEVVDFGEFVDGRPVKPEALVGVNGDHGHMIHIHMLIHSLIASGGTNIAHGFKISVLLLSDGHHVQIDTFNFTSDHVTATMQAISEFSDGKFPFINADDSIQEGFAQCIGGLVSIVVKEMQLSIESVDNGFLLNSIKSDEDRGFQGTLCFGWITVHYRHPWPPPIQLKMLSDGVQYEFNLQRWNECSELQPWPSFTLGICSMSQAVCWKPPGLLPALVASIDDGREDMVDDDAHADHVHEAKDDIPAGLTGKNATTSPEPLKEPDQDITSVAVKERLKKPSKDMDTASNITAAA